MSTTAPLILSLVLAGFLLAVFAAGVLAGRIAARMQDDRRHGNNSKPPRP